MAAQDDGGVGTDRRRRRRGVGAGVVGIGVGGRYVVVTGVGTGAGPVTEPAVAPSIGTLPEQSLFRRQFVDLA